MADVEKSENPFQVIKVRHLIWASLISLVLTSTIYGVLHRTQSKEVVHFSDIVLFMSTYIFVAGVAILLLRHRDVNIRQFIGPQPDPKQLKWVLAIVLPLMAVSVAFLYVMYLPLSYIAPDFVRFMLIDLDFEMISPEFSVIENGLAGLVIVLIGPVCEELVFRGVILHRWAFKWGLKRGMIGSSIAFGFLHADIFGAAFFGYVMCVLYIQSQSLWIPTIAHVTNNLIAMTIDFTTKAIYDTQPYTLQDFQSEWWIGGLCLPIASWWGYRYLKTNAPQPGWTLPYYPADSVREAPTGETP